MKILHFKNWGFFLTLVVSWVSCTEYNELLPTPRPLTIEEAFDALADFTDGERFDANNATEVPEVILEIIQGNVQPGSQIAFLIDNTGSMSDDIRAVKLGLTEILNSLPEGVKVGAATYSDLNVAPGSWFQWTNFSENFEDIQHFIDDIRVAGGGDPPESVYDGIVATVESMSWEPDVSKTMIVIGDAPPLTGFLTWHTLEETVIKCKSVGLTVNLYPILIKD